MWGALDDRAAASEEDDLYKIVGCNENSTEEQITTEYKLRAFKCHPDKNPGNESALLEFQELQEAVGILLDHSKRQDYDKWRNSQVSVSYKQWKSMNSRFQMTMHWAKPREQVMLEGGASNSDNCPSVDARGRMGHQDSGKPEGSSWGVVQPKNQKIGWKSEDADVYKGFRNYAI